jgi:hypothetical protein
MNIGFVECLNVHRYFIETVMKLLHYRYTDMQ